MNFFRKHFVAVALGLVALAAIAFILPYFLGDNSNNTQRVIELTADNVVFRKDAELSIYKKDSLLQRLEVQLAQTEDERAVGMWFVFENEAPRSFYMKNTLIPLDIIYLNKDKKVVSIAKNARPKDETSLPSEAPAMYVLEINGGLADKWGIEKGDRVEISKLEN